MGRPATRGQTLDIVAATAVINRGTASFTPMFPFCSHAAMAVGMGDRLAFYPFVIVRVSCRHCTRRGSYRLARLGAKYGPEIALDDLLRQLAGDCPHWTWSARWPGAGRGG